MASTDVPDGTPPMNRRRRAQGGSSKRRPTESTSSLCDQCRQVPLPGHKAAYLGHIQCLETLHRDAPGKLEMQDRNGAVPIHLAVRQCNVDALKWLLERFPAQCRAQAHGGETPTLIAAAQGSNECLSVLASATPASRRDLVKDTDVNGLASVHLAALFDRTSCVKWLLKHFGHRLVVLQSISGITPVHIAAATGHLPVLKTLLKSNKKGATLVDASGATPAYFAAQEGKLDCLRYLVLHSKLDALARCDDGMTAVHAAAQGGYLDILKFLVEVLGEGAVVTPMQDKGTPVHFAAALGHDEVLEWMLSLKSMGDAVNLTDEDLGTPAHDAADNGQVKCLRVLKVHGANMNVKDKDGATPISLALESDNPECRKWALEERKLIDPAKRPSRMEADALATNELTKLAMEGKRHVLPGVVEQTTTTTTTLTVPDLGVPAAPSRKKSDNPDSDIYAVPQKARGQKKQWDGSGPARLPAPEAEKAAENAMAVVNETPASTPADQSSDESEPDDDIVPPPPSSNGLGPPLMGSTPVKAATLPRSVSSASYASTAGPALPPRTDQSNEFMDQTDGSSAAGAAGHSSGVTERSTDSGDLTDGLDQVASQLMITPKKAAPAMGQRPKSATTSRTQTANFNLDLSRSNSDPNTPTKLIFDKNGRPIPAVPYPRLTRQGMFDSPTHSPKASPVASPSGSPLVLRKPFAFAAKPPSSPTVSRAHSLPKTHANEAAETAASLRKKSASLGNADSSHHNFIKKTDVADFLREDDDDDAS